jgi:hypothetical protein
MVQARKLYCALDVCVHRSLQWSELSSGSRPGYQIQTEVGFCEMSISSDS